MAAKATIATATRTRKNENFKAKRKVSPSAFLTGEEIRNGDVKVQRLILKIVSLIS